MAKKKHISGRKRAATKKADKRDVPQSQYSPATRRFEGFLDLDEPMQEQLDRLRPDPYDLPLDEIRKRAEMQLLNTRLDAAPGAQSTPRDVEKPLTQRPLSRESKRRASYVERIVPELKRIKKEMFNESYYDQVRRAHPKFQIFKAVVKRPAVKSWLETITSRRDIVTLALEIAAQNFDVESSTIRTDWSHRHSLERSRKKTQRQKHSKRSK